MEKQKSLIQANDICPHNLVSGLGTKENTANNLTFETFTLSTEVVAVTSLEHPAIPVSFLSSSRSQTMTERKMKTRH